MAEDQQPEDTTKPRSRFFQKFRNVVVSWFYQTRIGRRINRGIQQQTGQPLTYQQYRSQNVMTIQAVSKELEQRGNLLKLLQSRISEVTSVENRWDDADKILGKPKKEGLEDLYAQSKIFLDSETSEWDYKL